MNLVTWAIRHGVSAQALDELRAEIYGESVFPDKRVESEAGASAALRLEAAGKHVRIWRNNVGAAKTESGSYVRFGLANETAEMNKLVKSPDFFGWRPVMITQEMVGRVIGQCVGREVKAPGWTFTGTDREEAQQRFGLLMLADGCDWSFCTGAGTL